MYSDKMWAPEWETFHGPRKDPKGADLFYVEFLHTTGRKVEVRTNRQELRAFGERPTDDKGQHLVRVSRAVLQTYETHYGMPEEGSEISPGDLGPYLYALKQEFLKLKG